MVLDQLDMTQKQLAEAEERAGKSENEGQSTGIFISIRLFSKPSLRLLRSNFSKKMSGPRFDISYS